MAKIDRRDYLKRMGVAAGAVTGATQLATFAQQRGTSSKQQTAAPPVVDWPIANTLPATPMVEMFFLGIMGFRYDARTQECEIGIHHGSATHKFRVVVLENTSRVLYQSPIAGFPNAETKVELGITGKLASVSFLQGTGPLNRTTPQTNPQDFRWLFDLEHSDFYGFPLPLRPRVYRKRLIIKNGIFYTHDLTCSKFDVIGGTIQHLNIHLPTVMGARLVLNPGECVFLKVDGESVLADNAVCYSPRNTYQFVFSNTCTKPNGHPCEHNDFHLNFDVINIPHYQRFELVLKERCVRAKNQPLARLIESIKGPIAQAMVASDESPCQGAGYGQGGGFPTYPPG